MAKTYTFTEVKGLHKTLRMLPKEASAELREASLRISRDIATKAATKATGLGGVAKYIAPTIKARRDRVPVVQMGGNRRLPATNGRSRSGDKQTVGNVIWGTEWGSNRYRQFPPPTKSGRILWSTVRDESDRMIEEWGDALIAAVDAVARRNDG